MVPPITAISFFERRYRNDPLILQYAHRVLEQHPVDLTFFFVPQVVQALRYDDLGASAVLTPLPSSSSLKSPPIGYVSNFIFETAKISQLFCHQIIWNMKANCYRGDMGEIVGSAPLPALACCDGDVTFQEDPMKPQLTEMIDRVVASLSGEAREFYDREFGFFHEVTSISGKLKPYIKKEKAEKKVVEEGLQFIPGS